MYADSLSSLEDSDRRMPAVLLNRYLYDSAQHNVAGAAAVDVRSPGGHTLRIDIAGAADLYFRLAGLFWPSRCR